MSNETNITDPDAHRLGTTAPSRRHGYPANAEALAAYCPKLVDPGTWSEVAPALIQLILRQPQVTHRRAYLDLRTMARLVAFARETGIGLTPEELLADSALLSFDQEECRIGVPATSRAARRSVLRRLQTCHRGLPWRRARRVDSARVETLIPPTVVDDIRQFLTLLRKDTGDTAQAVVTLIQQMMNAPPSQVKRINAATSPKAARQMIALAAKHDFQLTRRHLIAARHYIALGDALPLATIIASHQLTYRDLDLGLQLAAVLPRVPARAAVAALRGGVTGRSESGDTPEIPGD